MNEKKFLAAHIPVPVTRMVEDIVGCKWSQAVLGMVRAGVNRPGATEHAQQGLSAKGLNERLRKLMRCGILARRDYAELPPRVEYSSTPFGRKFASILDGVEALQRDLDTPNAYRGGGGGS